MATLPCFQFLQHLPSPRFLKSDGLSTPTLPDRICTYSYLQTGNDLVKPVMQYIGLDDVKTNLNYKSVYHQRKLG